MPATLLPAPIIDPSKFELESRRESVETLLPFFFKREPAEADKSNNLWAVEGLLVPGRPERALLAVNIGDIIDETKERDDPKRIVAHGLDIANMLAAARLGRLTEEFPNVSQLEGDEVTIVIPRGKVAPLYEEGARIDPSANFQQPMAQAA